MADLSISLPSIELEDAFLGVVDVEAKIPAALEALGPIAGREVVVLDPGRGYRVRQLADRGALVTAVRSEPDALPAASADVVVGCWCALDGPASPEILEAERLLRPGGRLLLVLDYGRDDVCRLWPEAYARQLEWSGRLGPFLTSGFRIRVIHCRWTFESIPAAAELLGAAFGGPGTELAGRMKRARLDYNVAVYHRSVPGLGERDGQDGGVAGEVGPNGRAVLQAG